MVKNGRAPLKSPLLPLFLTVFVDVLGLTLVLPLLPFYAEHYGATPFEVTLIAASYAACQLVSGPILGRMSDRVGRKPVLLASQVGTFIGFLVLAYANQLWLIFLGRIIDGSTAGNLSIAQAYISDVTKPENRTKAFAVIGISFGMGFLIGPAISGQLAQRYGLAAPMFLAAGLSLLSVITTATMLPRVIQRVPDPGAPPRAPTGRSLAFGSFFGRPAPRRVLFEFLCFTFAFSTLIGGLGLFLKHRLDFDVGQAGWIFTFSGLIGAIVQGGLIGRLVKRFGEARLAAIGFASMTLGYGALALTTALPLLLISTALGGVGIAVVRPCLTTLLTRSVGRDEQGAVLGVSQSLTSVSSMTANPIAGLLIQAGHVGMVAWALVAAVVAAVGMILRLRPEPAAAETAPS